MERRVCEGSEGERRGQLRARWRRRRTRRGERIRRLTLETAQQDLPSLQLTEPGDCEGRVLQCRGKAVHGLVAGGFGMVVGGEEGGDGGKGVVLEEL